MSALDELSHGLTSASGADALLDAALAQVLDVPQDGYTGSVEACRRLVAAALPGWRLHIGYGASGIFPYAALVNDSRQRYAAEAPTVPLAILRALMLAWKNSRPAVS